MPRSRPRASVPAPTEAARSWDALRSTRALHLLLAPHGLAWLVPRIDKHYGPTAHRVVREQPYELTSVFGVGFLIADRIARAAGVAADTPGAHGGRVLHVLGEAERDGSTCLPVPEAVARPRALGASPPTQELLDDLVERGRLVIDDGYAYRPPTAALEAELARRVHEVVEPRCARPESRREETATPPASRRRRPRPRRRSSLRRRPRRSPTASRS